MRASRFCRQLFAGPHQYVGLLHQQVKSKVFLSFLAAVMLRDPLVAAVEEFPNAKEEMLKKFKAATRKAQSFEVCFKAEVEQQSEKVCEVCSASCESNWN